MTAKTEIIVSEIALAKDSDRIPSHHSKPKQEHSKTPENPPSSKLVRRKF
jgi:hypothetical protein